MAKSYSAAMRARAVDGKVILRDGQRRWLRFAKAICFDYKNDDGGAKCLAKMYKRRLKDLDGAAVLIGAFVFSRVDYFLARDDGSGRPYRGQTSYPRIDQPDTEGAKRWNRLMAPAQKAGGDEECDGGPGFVDRDFEIQSASDRAIGVQQIDSMYCKGTPHGQTGSQSKTYALNPDIHELGASDLFARGTRWEEHLTERCHEVLRQMDASADRDRVRSVATNAKAWSLTRKGLLVTVNPYELLPYATGSAEIIIPWSELRPYLAAGAPIPD